MTTAAPERKPLSDVEETPPSTLLKLMIVVFIVIPLMAVIAAIPVAWQGWLSWTDVVIFLVFYVLSAGGITVGFHRYFTHGSFKTNRTVKILLALTGSLAVEGSIGQWVADHRRHHAFSDEANDPHSPWRFGRTPWALTKGLWWAHAGWLFSDQQSSIERWAPDLAADNDLRRITRSFMWLVLASLLMPAVIGGLVTWSWQGAITAFFWAGLVRVALVHHVTWSINSICHVFGKRPFNSRDNSTNVNWLAIPSLGESWHNLHHADPTCARHGVLRGQIDASARAIRWLEQMRLAYDVRWPKPLRLAGKLVDPEKSHKIRGYKKALAAKTAADAAKVAK